MRAEMRIAWQWLEEKRLEAANAVSRRAELISLLDALAILLMAIELYAAEEVRDAMQSYLTALTETGRADRPHRRALSTAVHSILGALMTQDWSDELAAVQILRARGRQRGWI